MNSLISVIVPVYKVEKYLDKCVGSIVNQTYQNLEIILVDDGSPDNCPKMCDAWAEKDNRIQVIHKKNGGLSSARNAGLDLCSGDYICFADSDDWLDADMISDMQSLAEKANADVVMCDFYIEKTDGECEIITTESRCFEKEEALYFYLIDKIRPEVCNKMYKASLTDNLRFDEAIKYAEDVPFNYEVFRRSKKIYNSGVPKYHYLQNSGNSITTSYMTDARANSWKTLDGFVRENKNDARLAEASVWRFATGTFAVLSRVMQAEEFSRKYFDEITAAILSHKKEILSNRLLSKKYKLSVLLMCISKVLFKKFYLFINSKRGI